MPKYEDLKFIQDKILGYGNEVMIRKERGENIIIDELPPQYVPEKNVALDDIDSLLNDITDDISEGLGYSEQPEQESANNDLNLDDLDFNLDDEEKINEDLSDINDFNIDELPNIDEHLKNSDNAWEDIADDSFNELQNFEDDKPQEQSSNDSNLDDFNLDDIDFDSDDKLDFDEEQKEDNQDEFKLDEINFDDNDTGLPDLSEVTESDNNESDDNNLTDLSFEQEEETKEPTLADLGIDETDVGLIDETNFGDNDEFDNNIQNDNVGLVDIQDDLGLNDINFDDDAQTTEQSLADLGIEELNINEDNAQNENTDDLLDNLGSQQDNEENSFDNLDFDSSDTDALLDDFSVTNDEPAKDEDEYGLSFDDGNEGGLSLDDFNNDNYSIDDFAEQETDDGNEDITDESQDNINNDEENLDNEANANGEGSQPSKKVKEKASAQVGEDGSIKLTDHQRKQIIKSLSVMPKEAEIKIAQEIVSGKYTDVQLKPLLEALINKEKVINVVRIYEKITGDTSLSAIQNKKLSGQDFESKQKSLSYQFQKNIMPILSKLAIIMIVLLSVIALYVKVIDPTMKATHYYKEGKRNIDEHKFDNVEPFFKNAYEIQPRYKEVLEYARKYRAAKRQINAEEKYDLAKKLRPSKSLDFEMAEFYCEKGEYPRAEEVYTLYKSINDKDIPTLLGLASTYYQWAEKDRTKFEKAKNVYQDIIDIDSKNKDALYGNMMIAIAEKNDHEVNKYYKYMKEKITKNGVDEKFIGANIQLADYMLATHRYTDMQEILDLVAKNPKSKNNVELEYGYAKLKKALNIIGEEKIHLKNIVKRLEYMKNNQPLEYSEKLGLLSETYNALGENAHRFSKGSIESEQYYIKAIQVNRLNAKAHYNLGNYALQYKVDLDNAKTNLLEAEKLGFTNDTLNYNLGWITYKQHEYKDSFKRINKLLDCNPENSNLKLMLGTIYYQMGNYDFAEALLKETYEHFMSLKQINAPLDMEDNEHKMIAEMLVNSANNLGATLHRKYLKNGKSSNSVLATKYYHDSIAYYDKLKETKEMYLYEPQAITSVDRQEVRLRELQVTNATQNLRMVLYPAGGTYDPIVYEEFPLEYTTFM